MATYTATGSIQNPAGMIWNGSRYMADPNYKPPATSQQQTQDLVQSQKAVAASQLEIDSKKMALANQYREKEGATQRDMDTAQTQRVQISDTGATTRNRESLSTQKEMPGIQQAAQNKSKDEDVARARGAIAAFSRGF